MLSRPLPRFAIVATVLLLLASGSYFARAAPADDGPKAAHEAAVLDRIFANWKARHDRVSSFHFVFDCRTTCKKGSADFLSRSNPPAVLSKDQVFEQRGAELWVEGDDRMCEASTPHWKLPHASSIDKPRSERNVILGPTTARYWGSASPWLGDASPQKWQPCGVLWRTATDRPLSIYGSGAILLAFRPQHPSLSWLRKDCRLVDEKALLNEVPHVELQRVVQSKRIPGGRIAGYAETIWTSPARDDLVVRWKTESGAMSTCLGRINYTKDRTHGWIPFEWSCDYSGVELDEYKVTSYSINEKIDPTVFSTEFPAGTPVYDQRAERIRYFVVEKDGSHRTLSPQEFARLREPH